MANAFNANPMVLDTVWTAGTIPAALTAITSPQRFKLIKWVNPTTIGHELKLIDASAGANVLFDEFASVAQQPVVLWDNPGNPYVFKQGLWVLLTLASGKLYLYR